MAFPLFLMRLVLGGIFIYSGFSKLIPPVENFIAAIESYQFLPPVLIPPVAKSLPWLELVFGTFLFVGFLTRFSSVILGIFSVTFVTLLARSMILGLPLTECGCFGAGISLEPKYALILDSGLFLTALCVTVFSSRLFSLDKRLQK